MTYYKGYPSMTDYHAGEEVLDVRGSLERMGRPEESYDPAGLFIPIEDLKKSVWDEEKRAWVLNE